MPETGETKEIFDATCSIERVTSTYPANLEKTLS